MKTKWTKRLLSGFLSLMMLVCLIPTSALAVEPPTDGSRTILVDFATDGVDGIQEAINLINKQEEKTGWTIEVGTGTYNRFVVLSGLDDLTVKAAEGADVTVETLNGSTPPDITFGGGIPNTGGISILNADNVTLDRLTIHVPASAESDPWQYAGVSNYSESREKGNGLTVSNCTFTGNNGEHGIFIDAGTTNFSVTNCTFTDFVECISMYGDGTVLNSAAVTDNTFTNSSFAIHGYYYTSDTEANGGTLTFTNNTVTGTDDLRCKIVLQNGSGAQDNQQNSAMKVNVSENTLTNAVVGLVNLSGADWNTDWSNDVFANNTFNDYSFYVEAIEPGTINYYTTYQAPEGSTGHWASFLDPNSDITQDQIDYVNELIAQANANGDKTLSITGIPDGDLITTFTSFKDGIYWVSGEPKVSLPGMDKSIVLTDEEGNKTEVDEDTVSAGDTVDFELESTVPEDLAKLVEYSGVGDNENVTTDGKIPEGRSYVLTFHDKIANAFEIDSESFVVKIGNITLQEDQYTLTQTDLSDNCTFEVELDLAKLYNEGIIDEDDMGKTPITVTYTATLKEGTNAGNYVNEAWVHYPDANSEHDTVTVKTFDITVFKYDQATATGEGDSWTAKGLPGAIFTLYSDEDCTVVVDTATSDNDGYATFTGLDTGTYYLKETAAPEGYVKSDKALEVTITVDTADNTVSVSFANSPIPHTGGMGTTLFSIVGGVLIAMAGTIFVISRRKRRA